jgi:protein-L-isoaspartate(D-aspartate) O-methyltransferase
MDTTERRASFAGQIAAKAGIPVDGAVAAAFRSTPREDFVGGAPWTIFGDGDHSDAEAYDPAFLYQDIVVALKQSAGINNGQPSLHALCLAALEVRHGETAVHVGAGTGYYTAILAKLVGETGRVEAYEIDEDMGKSARRNLATMAQVRVHAASGTVGPLPECDLLYVNAGASSPLAVWLDALGLEGRLLFPLTPDEGAGPMLLVSRQADGSYGARALCPVVFIPCVGARDVESERRLSQALKRRKMDEIRSLHRDNAPDESAWCEGNGWWLSTRP